MKRYPIHKQLSAMDCGPSCLKMICSYYHKNVGIDYLHDLCQITKEGVSLHGMANAAQSLGLKPEGVELNVKGLLEHFNNPCILHWQQNHFVVLYDIVQKKNSYKFCIGDPCSNTIIYLTLEEFLSGWIKSECGIALFIETTDDF